MYGQNNRHKHDYPQKALPHSDPGSNLDKSLAQCQRRTHVLQLRHLIASGNQHHHRHRIIHHHIQNNSRNQPQSSPAQLPLQNEKTVSLFILRITHL